MTFWKIDVHMGFVNWDTRGQENGGVEITQRKMVTIFMDGPNHTDWRFRWSMHQQKKHFRVESGSRAVRRPHESSNKIFMNWSHFRLVFFVRKLPDTHLEWTFINIFRLINWLKKNWEAEKVSPQSDLEDTFFFLEILQISYCKGHNTFLAPASGITWLNIL